MILAVDSTALALLINPRALPPHDPNTGAGVAHAHERVTALLKSLSSSDAIIVPTPVLAEVLVKAGEGAPAVFEALQGQARVRVASFDERAAIELAVMTKMALSSGDKRGGSNEPWQKVKFDRQILAIARVAGADRIYSDDAKLKEFASKVEMDVVSTWELPIPEGLDNLFTSAGLPPDGSTKYQDD